MSEDRVEKGPIPKCRVRIVVQKKDVYNTDDEASGLLRSAGFSTLTPLQKKTIPLILKGKDLVIQTRTGEGKTAAYLAAIITRHGRAPASGRRPVREPRFLVVTDTASSTVRIARQFANLTRRTRHSLRMLALGGENAQRQETSDLSRGIELVIGSTERIIDHLRRGNLVLTGTELFVIDDTGTGHSARFVSDLLFILSKTARRRQTVLLSSSIDDLPSELTARLYMPIYLDRESWSATNTERLVYRIGPGEDEFEAAADIFESGAFRRTVVYTSCQDRAEHLRRVLRKRRIRCRYLGHDARISVKTKTVQCFNNGEIDGIIFIHDSIRHEKLDRVENIVFFDPPGDDRSYTGTESFFLDGERACRVISILRGDERVVREHTQEMQNVNMKEVELPTEEEVLKGTIQSIVKRIKLEENPDELTRFRSLIRKNVPLSLRGYFMAYLFKELQQKKGRPKRSNFTTLFVGVGKNRKVFPRDILQLFQSSLGISKNELGEIKVLDNYSFVEIVPEYAEKAIETLNGSQVRGRRITVNFARKKDSVEPEI